ncbi:hypothetical protein BsWGS_08520 [Bradybaena similaris]
MPCCGVKAHWILGTILNMAGFWLLVVGFFMPTFTAVYTQGAVYGMWHMTYMKDGNFVYHDIADWKIYMMTSSYWRLAEGLAATGLTVNAVGNLLFQVFQCVHAPQALPVAVAFVFTGSIFSASATVIFQHNSKPFDEEYTVTPGAALFLCVNGVFFSLIGAFVLMISATKTIKKFKTKTGSVL